MADDRGRPNNTLVLLKMEINGKPIDDDFMLVSCKVERTINRVSRATVALLDGNRLTQGFKASESKYFVPGNEIEILAGYEHSTKSIFKGVIISQGIKARGGATSELQISCADKSLKMTLGRKSKYFEQKTDADIIQELIKANGLEAKVKATTHKYPTQVQYYATDWDFICSRAEANGLMITNKDGEVKVDKPSLSTKPVYQLNFGENVLDFDLNLDAENQMQDVLSKSWDVKSQKVIQGKSKEPSLNHQGDISGKTLAEVLNIKDFQLQSSASIDQTELKSWADAQLLKARMSSITGYVEFFGNADVYPDDLLELKGFGNRFNGNAYVAGVVHTITNGDWRTEATIGLQKEEHAKQTGAAALASGLIPGVAGLHVGTVQKIEDDPDRLFRILVNVPMSDPNGTGIWARLSNFYASQKAGSFFMPEINDEVIVGFINGDPRCAVILGMLHSLKHPAPFHPKDKNSIKAIVTRNQLKITFDEEKRDIMIETPGKNRIILSDQDSSIELLDKNRNKVILNRSGITLDSNKDIVLKAKGNIKIAADTYISQDAKADINISGLNIKNNAKVGFAAKGNAQAELSANGQTVVKGAMVLIN